MHTITVQHTLSEQLLKDILTIAAEGGITYWARGKTKRDDDLNVLEAWLTPGESPDEFEEKHVTLDLIAQGVAKLFDPTFSVSDGVRGNVLSAVINDDACYIDADDADCVVQAAVFGELVYG